MEEASMVVNNGEHHELIDLPPGFRFHPTDEEIITCYLTEKVMNSNFTATAIGEADLNKCEPWDLPKKAKMGEKEWYFFCQRDRKYPTGMRTNRATESGYWKATGKDKEIYKGKSSSLLVGMKKTLVFYRGRAPKGEKTNWVMHEYRLEGKYHNLAKPTKDEWAVCRVFHKNMGLIKKTPIMNTQGQLLRINSFEDHDHDLLDYSSLPPLMDIPTSTHNKPSGYAGDPQDLKPKTSDGLSSNYLNYLPTNSNYYNSYQASLSNPMQTPSTMLYPHHVQHHQFPNHSFSFPPNPNFTFRSDDDEAILRTIAMAGAGNNNDIETSSTAAAAGGLLTETRQCKVEQFSCNNQSSMFSVSQDTGLSTDMNTNTTEISSSLVSKQENMGTNNNNNNSSSSSYDHEHLHDIEGLWDF